jgi:hypothetical protein
VKRIVFDIETQPFTEAFKDAESIHLKTRLAPRMRLACAFDESRSTYRYFGPRGGRALARLLQSADELVSFNGKRFDVLILRRHCGLKGRAPLKGRQIDLCEITTAMAGFRVSLDAAAKLNLGERRHTYGRNMASLAFDELKVACRSDVCQTYRLFQRHINGTLEIPAREWEKLSVDSEELYSNTPHECPSCHALHCLEEVDWGTDEMTDGQHSDYLAGLYGSAICRNCGDEIDWGF